MVAEALAHGAVKFCRDPSPMTSGAAIDEAKVGQLSEVDARLN